MTEHTAHTPNLGHHFDTLEQQHEANVLGLWFFLITEVMLFGGLFTAYFVYRAIFPQAFAEASHHLNIVLGGINTVVLILSSLCVALAVHAAQTNNRRLLPLFLGATMVLGVVFLGIKGVEYYEHFLDHQVPGALFIYEGEHPERAAGVEMFNLLYFSLTGTHAIHMIIGLSIVGVMLFRSWRGKYGASYYTPIELTGLYWHFVDIVWVFLFPMLYLMGRH
jgi:cytochrome c oxidase subunit III